MFLVYGYHKNSIANYNLLLTYYDRGDGYLAYIGSNDTQMIQVQNTSGELNLYIKPGE